MKNCLTRQTVVLFFAFLGACWFGYQTKRVSYGVSQLGEDTSPDENVYLKSQQKMKFLILTDMRQLTESLIGLAFITQNPYKVLSQAKFSSVQLYTCENEMPEGRGYVRIQNGKVFTQDSKVYGCDPIGNVHTIIFDPDPNYPNLGVGSAKEMSLLSIAEDPASESAVILISEEPGPNTWTQSVYLSENLDFGGERVIQAVALQ